MPKCLDCGQTKKFTYTEECYHEAEYDDEGSLLDSFYAEYLPIKEGACYECESTNIEGEL